VHEFLVKVMLLLDGLQTSERSWSQKVL